MITDLKSADILLISDNFLLEQKEINEVLSKEALMGTIMLMLGLSFGVVIWVVLLLLCNKFDWDVSGGVSVIISLILGFICAYGLIAWFGLASSDTGSGRTDTAVCKSCGRSFEAGDDDGNFMNIARTGMCNNCYNNYQWGQKAIGN